MFKFAITNCDCLRFDFGRLCSVAWTNPSVVGGGGGGGGGGTNLRSRGHLVRAREQILITDDAKKAIKRKHCVYRKYVKQGRKPEDWTRVKQVKNDTTKIITDAKNKYFSWRGAKLCDPYMGIRTYWKTLHKIINKKQVMNIPPILLNSVFITNFENKANLFNDFFRPAVFYPAKR